MSPEIKSKNFGLKILEDLRWSSVSGLEYFIHAFQVPIDVAFDAFSSVVKGRHESLNNPNEQPFMTTRDGSLL